MTRACMHTCCGSRQIPEAATQDTLCSHSTNLTSREYSHGTLGHACFVQSWDYTIAICMYLLHTLPQWPHSWDTWGNLEEQRGSQPKREAFCVQAAKLKKGSENPSLLEATWCQHKPQMLHAEPRTCVCRDGFQSCFGSIFPCYSSFLLCDWNICSVPCILIMCDLSLFLFYRGL